MRDERDRHARRIAPHAERELIGAEDSGCDVTGGHARPHGHHLSELGTEVDHHVPRGEGERRRVRSSSIAAVESAQIQLTAG